MTAKLAIFDIDGTLVNSRESLQAAADEAFTFLGLPPPPYEELRKIVGLSLREGLAQLAPQLKEDQIQALFDHYRRSFKDLHKDPDFIEPLYDGAAALLDRLKREGWLIAMATGKSRGGVETIIAMHGWADLFDTTHCADDGPGKPHPAMVQAALEVMGASPAQAVMIGDTAHDVLMARAAGVRALGVTWGFHTRSEIEESGADEVLDTFSELDDALTRFAVGV
jgi:phosphoglycolate phosphatase